MTNRLQEGSTASKESTNVCSVCFNVDVFEGSSQIEEAHAAYISKVQAIENLHYTITPERMQHLV